MSQGKMGTTKMLKQTPINVRAAQALIDAAEWWRKRPDGFLRHAVYDGPTREPIAMCSEGNLAFHATGSPVGDLNDTSDVVRAARRAVLNVAGVRSELSMCGLNNGASRETMITLFERGASLLKGDHISVVPPVQMFRTWTWRI